MKLRYHITRNFGDALNPYIFNYFLTDFFDDKEDTDFFGIGSILGFLSVAQSKKKIIFSSGHAYGPIPQIDSSFDIICVRGPLTCKLLNLESKLAVTDGATLLQFMPIKNQEKKYAFSFMSHWESSMKFDWEQLCNSVGINYISSTNSYSEIIKDILSTKVLITEALHGAIVADTFRIPWIPIKAYNGINEFKWQDWASSLSIEYKPIRISSLYNNTSFTRKIIKEKIKYPFKKASLSPFINIYEKYQYHFLIDKVRKELETLKNNKSYLSHKDILQSKGNQLLDLLEKVQLKYHA